jgi:glutathione synthase
MRFLFLVNDVSAIAPSQTTAMLIAAAARNHEVWVTDVTALSCHNQGLPQAHAKKIKIDSQDTLPALMAKLAHLPWQTVSLEGSAVDILFIRTNPARDLARSAAHQIAMAFTQLAQDRGVRVVNRPDGLIRAATKLYLLELPAFVRPESLVSQNRAEIVAFIENLQGPAVVKPLQGTRGSDVFFVSSHTDKNLNQMLDVILRQGLAMVQRCLPNAEAGDTRVVVINGQILEIDGQPGAICRVPAEGDFRSNLHTGGMAKPGVISAGMHQVVAAIGNKLVDDGLFLVGLDFMGDQLLEINVFSTGGLRDAERFTGKAFAKHIVETFALAASGD